MSTPDELRELVRQTRVRLGEAERLRAELHVITVQTDRRLHESRRLLQRSEVRRAGAAQVTLHRV